MASLQFRSRNARYKESSVLFTELAEAVTGAPPMRPKPLDQDGLLNLFDSKDTGGDITLVPATDVDMRGKNAKPKASLEVVYDEA